ncbi:MAG: hypothetical protein A6F72_04730 [Cycloclasticus sp. symbiont of Poecilosclerida sp. N]|nr:MAG: hypothetical protein A6F72_04730 [Cycloclasticus sp. symbiont of Poecilosclerida sp. N]
MENFSLYPEAELDLEGIWHYTVSAWSVEQAIKYIDELDALLLSYWQKTLLSVQCALNFNRLFVYIILKDT